MARQSVNHRAKVDRTKGIFTGSLGQWFRLKQLQQLDCIFTLCDFRVEFDLRSLSRITDRRVLFGGFLSRVTDRRAIVLR